MPLLGLLRRFTSPCQVECQPRGAAPVAFDLAPALGYPLKLYLAPWRSETPFSWASYVEQERIASGNFLEPPGIGWEMLNATQGEMLTHGMPKPVRRAIANAPFLGVELAQACGQLPAARELAEASPLLLIMLVDWAIETRLTRAEFADCLTQKQAVLCDAVGLPGGPATAKLLKCCGLRPMIRRELFELKRTLNRPRTTALLRHHQPLCLDHVVFMARHEGFCWPGLLRVVDGILDTQPPRPGQVAWLRQLLADVERILGDNRQALPQVTNMAELQCLHDRLVDRFNEQINQAGRATTATALRNEYGAYPPPPLPAYGDLTPVTSWEDLLLEGQRMRHCVGSYHHAVATGRVAIYHLRSPEPVTVAIRPQGNGWVLSEARVKCNFMPSASSRQKIQAWLARCAG
ncbi:PcfJ domain-containing protein [Halomonas chromatireducens]|uniref:PcfJ domain-containing protein n=1 Tax=Halomonas chromatireducens TaxID=507626 RepID=UPI00130E3DF6|nr:PcfJ domain-containing protein [Halomonas chromatireducens]